MGEASKVIIPLFGILDITGEVIAMWILLVVLLVISLVIRCSLKLRPGVFQNMVETGVEYLDTFLSDILGKKNARKYFFFLASLFVFIIFANYMGLFPGVGKTDYVKAPTSSLSTTVGLGICAFLFLQIAGIRHGVKQYFKRFVSPLFFMMPLMLLDEIIKPVSLAFRLYGNVFGEELVTENLYDLVPVGPPIIMMALSLLFCALQAVVFTMLVSIYLDEMIEEEPQLPKKKKTKRKLTENTNQ